MTDPVTAEKRVALAAVAGAHGIKGEVRLKLFTDSVANLARHRQLFVGGKPLTLQSARDAGKTVIARFDGIVDRTAAEGLRGALIEIDRAALPPLADGEYYLADIVGLICVDGAGMQLGTVAAVDNFGAGDLLEIERADGKRALIPFREPMARWDGDRILLDPEFLA